MKTIKSNPCDHCSRLEEQKEQQHYFISHLSHEVRNPLTLVSSSLQLLEKDCPTVKDSVLWSQIREDVQSTIALLQDISTFNNLVKLKLSSFGAEEFLTSLAGSFSSYMEQRNIRFMIQLHPSLSLVSLNADRRKLQEALTNLLINAADALCDSKLCDFNLHESESSNAVSSAIVSDVSTSNDIVSDDSASGNSASNDIASDNSVSNNIVSDDSESNTIASDNSSSDNSTSNDITSVPSIILTADLFDKILHIHVKDNGPGIPDTYLETLFDPFVTHKSTGTGLGLSIVQSVANLHGGSISVDTCCEPGNSYTDFCLKIPVS